MARPLAEWVQSEVEPVRDRPVRWLSEHHFFRDPMRATFTDPACFFSPADGIILYQRAVDPDEAIVDLKGVSYTLRDALADPWFDRRCLVIGVFMSFFDVHVNRVPYPGRLSWRPVDPVATLNRPMLPVESGLLNRLRVPDNGLDYVRWNQRTVNRIRSDRLGGPYWVVQIADYDVDSILPFNVRQNAAVFQGARFSQIRFGSQVELIIPLSDAYELVNVHPDLTHVEAGTDVLVRLR